MKSEKKISYVIGDFNMNCLKYHKNAKTKRFYNNIFEKGAISVTNRVGLESQNIRIDNILTTDISNNSLKKGITKSEVLSHFPIFFIKQLTKEKLREGVIKVKKRVLNNRNMNSFREQLSLLHWRQTDLELRTWQVIRNN